MSPPPRQVILGAQAKPNFRPIGIDGGRRLQRLNFIVILIIVEKGKYPCLELLLVEIAP